MMKEIEIKDKDLLKNLEISCQECSRYQNILNLIKLNGYNEQYWKIWSLYMDAKSECDTIKEFVRINWVIPAVGENYPGWWEINFDNHILIIHSNKKS